MKLIDKLIKIIPSLDPITFAGLAKILGVELYDTETKEPHDFTFVLGQVLQAFEAKDRKFKRELLTILNKGIK